MLSGLAIALFLGRIRIGGIDLLFSFECCLDLAVGRSGMLHSSSTCYFLLNVVCGHGELEMVTAVAILLFSFECCHAETLEGVSLRRVQACYFLLNVVRPLQEIADRRQMGFKLAIFF